MAVFRSVAFCASATFTNLNPWAAKQLGVQRSAKIDEKIWPFLCGGAVTLAVKVKCGLPYAGSSQLKVVCGRGKQQIDQVRPKKLFD